METSVPHHKNVCYKFVEPDNDSDRIGKTSLFFRNGVRFSPHNYGSALPEIILKAHASLDTQEINAWNTDK